ncbi:MAG: N-acetylmuramoyl-L-alanine amidase [Rickettsiales bacterium]|nr:N-acetylmuramoyl-L-alanine amidase [Rickettsiales bacterium]
MKTSVQVEPRSEFVVFHLNGAVEQQKMFRLQNPERLVIDLSKVENSGVQLPADYRGRLLNTIRFGQFDEDTSRIVIELREPVESAQTHRFSASQKFPHARFVVEVVPRANFKAGTGPSPVPTSYVSGSSVSATQTNGYPIPILKPTHEAEVAKPHIFIDAGHGGKDPGALGGDGTQEKNITLLYARHLAEAIEKSGRYAVTLTRDDDRFILLPDRVAIARAGKGDLFISIHADTASSAKARGLSIYTVSENASDAEAAALAEQENSVDLLSGMDVGVEDKAVADILLDLTQRETKNKSSKLADVMVQSFRKGGVRLLPNTHRFAGFRVLKAPEIPSVLVEIGFLSNPDDERNLKSTQYRRILARGIIDGLDAYYSQNTP